MNRIKKTLAAVLMALLFLSGCSGQKDNPSVIESNDNLEVHFIDVGQGDATLIRQGEYAMLIDAGDNSKGTAMQAYLQSQNIDKLDYVIGTHPDSDHIGGLDVVLYKFDWDVVMMPDVDKDTRTYEDVVQVIQDKNRHITVPKAGEQYSLGAAEFTVVCPQKADYGDNSNDSSIGIRLEFGETSFLFTGDAEEASERDMLESGADVSADVFKAAHHGSDTANTPEFLEAVNPKAVVISCGEGNSYGHPGAAVVNYLQKMGVDIYRTDEQGTIVACSDGRTITWNTGRSENQERYVLNENTGKFHKPSCNSVEEMAEKNRNYVEKSREELLEEGYEPCKRCNP